MQSLERSAPGTASRPDTTYDRRRRFTPLTLLTGRTGSTGSFVLVLSTTTSSVLPAGASDTHTVAGPLLVMDRPSGNGHSLPPGQPATVTVGVHNVGSRLADGLVFTAGPCVQSARPGHSGVTDFCSALRVSITVGDQVIYHGSATGLGARGPIDLSGSGILPGGSLPLTFSVRLDPAAGNAYQSINASQRLTVAVAS